MNESRGKPTTSLTHKFTITFYRTICLTYINDHYMLIDLARVVHVYSWIKYSFYFCNHVCIVKSNQFFNKQFV